MRPVYLGLVLLAGCAATQRTAPPPPDPSTGGDPQAIPAEKFDELNQFFHRKAAQLRFTCYDREVERTHQKYEGNVSLSVMVLPGNKAGEIRVTESSLKNPPIEQCIVEQIRSWDWPEVPAPAPFTGSLNFKPAW